MTAQVFVDVGQDKRERIAHTTAVRGLPGFYWYEFVARPIHARLRLVDYNPIRFGMPGWRWEYPRSNNNHNNRNKPIWWWLFLRNSVSVIC